jgi:hypothetical protein
MVALTKNYAAVQKNGRAELSFLRVRKKLSAHEAGQGLFLASRTDCGGLEGRAARITSSPGKISKRGGKTVTLPGGFNASARRSRRGELVLKSPILLHGGACFPGQAPQSHGASNAFDFFEMTISRNHRY